MAAAVLDGAAFVAVPETGLQHPKVAKLRSMKTQSMPLSAEGATATATCRSAPLGKTVAAGTIMATAAATVRRSNRRARRAHARRLAKIMLQAETDLRSCIPMEELRNTDVPKVGGKSASLGEMIGGLADAGVLVPGGFSTTAQAYKNFLAQNDLGARINVALDDETIYTDVTKLQEVGKTVRQMVMDQPLPPSFEADLKMQWERVSQGNEKFQVAVRSSATAEDLPDASFAGQQETFLNVSGYDDLVTKVHECFASLFTDRAISYRHDKGFDHKSVQLCACIQKMVRSEEASAGVMFTLDTESGFRDVVFITAAWGLGETVVGGTVNPDEWYVFKPTLEKGLDAVVSQNMGSKLVKMVYKAEGGSEVVDTTEQERKTWAITKAEATELAVMAMKIEQHYGRPMDIEWCKDADDGKLYIVQARPETVASREKKDSLTTFTMEETGDVVCEGSAVGKAIGSGKVNVLKGLDGMASFERGSVLVADMTDPDWEPVMSKASAIVTNRGGRTCHAAIIARELGIPAVVGTGNGTDVLSPGDEVTVSCAEGDVGKIYSGELKFRKDTEDIGELPELGFKIMMNVGNPAAAFQFAQIPNAGIGLARLEFVINNAIGIHPKALFNYDTMDAETKGRIDERIKGYASPVDFYVEKIVEGVATLAASVYPKRIIVRLSDFKSNEYKSLIGGEIYEPDEENPMIGFRGCGRYADPAFEDCFALELQAMKKVREEMGLTNVELMIPFVRTLEMADDVLQILEKNGLKRGENDLKVNMMAELPSNVFMADEFLERFDGFSIGSNDLTQLTLGLDRDSGLVAQYFNEENPAVKKALSILIQAAKEKGKYVGICGQGPSDSPELAKWLMKEGIDSVSLNPDSVIPTWLYLGKSS